MNSSERHARQRVRSHKDNRKRGAVRALPACRSADVWLTKPPSSATTARTPTIVVRLDGLPPSTRYFIGIGLSSRRTVMGIFLMRNVFLLATLARSEEHTSELQSLMRISYAVFCLKKKII